MKYLGHENDVAHSVGTTGVLLINLGTPERAVCPALRKYLAEFLMDPRVIELPKLLRLILVRGIIVNFRAHKSAATYRKIWTEQGSPLLTNSAALSEKVQAHLGSEYQVELSMRYGEPSVPSALQRLHESGCRTITVVPLYPQYSGSTTGSSFDAVAGALIKRRWVPELQFINSYWQRPGWVAAIGESIKRHWQAHGQAQKLIISFHGIPKKYVSQGDPYYSQCQASAEAISEYLNLSPERWMMVFQSRFGAEPWLQPYCDKTLEQLPAQGIKSIDIICPGFSADCLETLEEIQMENKDIFLQSGGEHYVYIPCLNDSDSHASLLANLIRSPAPTQ